MGTISWKYGSIFFRNACSACSLLAFFGTTEAKTAFATKKFQLADNCAIVVNGRTDGQLSDLKLNDKLLFSYDEINGVNVVNRIGPAEAPADNVAVSPPPTGYGYGY